MPNRFPHVHYVLDGKCCPAYRFRHRVKVYPRGEEFWVDAKQDEEKKPGTWHWPCADYRR